MDVTAVCLEDAHLDVVLDPAQLVSLLLDLERLMLLLRNRTLIQYQLAAGAQLMRRDILAVDKLAHHQHRLDARVLREH